MNRTLAAVFFCCFLVGACAEKRASDVAAPGYDALTAAGARCLASNEGESAASDFAAAVAVDATRPEAKFGYLLAGEMRFANLIDQLIGTINGLSFTKSLGPSAAEDPIHEYLNEKMADLLAQGQADYDSLAAGPDFVFPLDSYALQAAGTDLLLFSGNFDEIDLRFFGALESLLEGLTKTIAAYDLRFDYTVLHIPKSTGTATTIQTIDEIVTLLDGLLSSREYPTFLELLPPDGPAYLNAAGVSFGDAFARLGELFTRLEAARGPRDQAAIGYVDGNRNNRWNPESEPLLIGSTLILSPAITTALIPLVGKISRAFYEGSAADADPAQIDVLTLADFNELLAALGVLPIKIGPLALTGLPDWPQIDVGAFFAEPQMDGLRDILEFVVKIWKLVRGADDPPALSEGT